MALGNKAWQVEQSAGVCFKGRGQVETYFAAWAEILVCHNMEIKVRRQEGAKVKTVGARLAAPVGAKVRRACQGSPLP